MGWITTHRAKGITNDAWFQANVLGEQHEVVVSSTIKNVYYAAVRTIETGEVWGLVCLIHRAPRNHHNFGWKDMDETCGPNAAEAPAKVLDALTPTDSEWANEWRAKCRRNLDTKLEAGQVIRVPGMSFKIPGRNGLVSITEFTYAPQPRRKDCFSVEINGVRQLVRLPEWKSYSYELVQEVSA